ncbi:MAG: thiamine pyrophosphate-dependent enzyme, partial [Bacilli bacterium]
KRVRETSGDEYFDEFVLPINQLDGYDLPVSAFNKYDLEDGSMRPNVTFKEDRSIADRVPEWNKDYCIQCNQCAFVCPHSTIRPFLLNEEEIKNGPEGLSSMVKDAVGPQVKGYKYIIQISPKNCVGCGLCASECMANQTATKLGNDHFAIKMVEAKSQFGKEKYAEYLYKHVEYKSNLFPTNSVKGVGFMMPYQEISGACQGCGETPYYRLLSQLFGKDLLIANATGCSSIYNGSTPMTPFVTDKNGQGPAWANSLFEDNAEYGYGMRLATNYKLQQISEILTAAEGRDTVSEELKGTIKNYLEHIKDKEEVRKIIPELIKEVEASKDTGVKEVLKFKNDLLDKSVWIIGGDGFAYDIGYGGLDHVIASEDDINVLVLDNEQYANTGGQASKSTQTGCIAQFAASGKKTKKKNLALIAMAYGDVYVAQVALGSNPLKAIAAFKEAESYNGPSLIICYAPCINQGIKGGLVNSIKEEKKAVDCGFFTTWRYDPRLVAEGKPGLTLDCKEPDFTKFREFLLTENRFSQLPKVNPTEYEELFTKSEAAAKERWAAIKKFGL